MEIEKVIRILAIFIAVAAFAIKVATHLMFPGASHTGDIPILILLTLSVCSIWRDALRTKSRTKIQTNKPHEKTPHVRRYGSHTGRLYTQDSPRAAFGNLLPQYGKTGYQISPDGKYFSYMAPYESRRNIFVQPVDGKDAVRITSETERDLAGYFWANDHRILYLKDTGGDENFQLYGVDIDGSNPQAYTAIPGVRTQIIDPLEEIDSLMIIGTNQRNPMIFDPYRLNLSTGEMTMLCENPGDIQGWQTDHDGKLRVAYAIVDGVNTQIRYRETEAEPFRPVLTTNFKEGVSFATFTPDNKLVYAITNLGRDKSALVLMDPATCEELEQLYTNDKYDLRGIWYSDAQKNCRVFRTKATKA